MLMQNHRWEAGLPKWESMGKEDPIKEDRLSMLCDHQVVSTNGGNAWEV